MDFLDKYQSIVYPDPNSGCWLCVSSNNQYGYARVKVGGRMIGAHRISYEMSRGAIKAEMEIDHLCRTTCCVNPDHLEMVTQAENKRRQSNAMIYCRHGHLRAGENLYLHPRGSRQCRECACMSRLRYRAKLVGDAA